MNRRLQRRRARRRAAATARQRLAPPAAVARRQARPAPGARVVVRRPGHAPDRSFPNRRLFGRQAYGLQPLTLELTDTAEDE